MFNTRAKPLLGTMLFASAVLLLRDNILRLIDRWFFREAYDPEQILISLGSQARRARSIDEFSGHRDVGRRSCVATRSSGDARDESVW